MTKNKVLEAIYSRRSIRDYSQKAVPEEVVKEILKAGTMAPSSGNTQPWRFSIIEGKKNREYFGEVALRGILGERKFLELKRKNPVLKKKKAAQLAEKIFYNAPLLIVVSGEKNKRFLQDDINLAAQNMFLAAHSLGIGSCWIGFRDQLNRDPIAKKMLGVPENFEIVAPLIFGYSKEKPKIPKRELKIFLWKKNGKN